MFGRAGGRRRAEHASVCETCGLDCVRAGEHLEIISVDDDNARVQALRFGMAEGSCVECVTRIPAGPLVLKSGRQEIAVGRSLAKRIRVRRRGGHGHGGHHGAHGLGNA